MNNFPIFFNDLFKLVVLLERNEEIINGKVCTKMSQDKMSELLGISKHTINTYLKELKQRGFLEENTSKSIYMLSAQAKDAVSYLLKPIISDKTKNYTCASFFAGVGGIELGFKNNGFNITYANEFDSKAIHTYEKNFGVEVDNRDIQEVVNELQSGKDPFNGKKFDVFLAGFPCQAFSIAGYREGFDDKKGRGNLFFEVMKIAKVMQPKIIFLENVKNLVSHDGGKTFKIIRETLESEGYFIKYQVLNSMDYGNVPQNRERIYIVAFKDLKMCEKFRFPMPIELTEKLCDVIDYDKKVDDRFYYTDKFLHYDTIKEAITRKDTVYQWRRVYVRENKNNVCPTLTANMGTGGHNVPLILTDYGIRKLTPKECFRLQGYPESYKLPNDIAMSSLYKQAGNSVSVSVIERIAWEIARVL